MCLCALTLEDTLTRSEKELQIEIMKISQMCGLHVAEKFTCFMLSLNFTLC